MFADGEIRKSHVVVVIIVVLINVAAFLGAARFVVVFYQLPAEAKALASQNRGISAWAAGDRSVNAYFPVCVLLSVGDDTHEPNDAALPFPLFYRLFDSAKAEMLHAAKPNGAVMSWENWGELDPRVEVLVGVDFPSLACKLANDSLYADFIDGHPDLKVELTCGSPEVVKRNLAGRYGANSSTSLELKCGTVIAGQSSKYVSQINAAWVEFLRWDNFRAIDLDRPDPSRNPPALPREQWRPTIITACSSNHLAVTLLLLRSLGKAGQEVAESGLYNISVVMYALEEFDAVLQGILGCVVRELNEEFQIPTEVRQFNFSAHPSWMRIDQAKGFFGGTGEYAWKPVLIHEVLVERGFVVWVDGGSRFERSGLVQTLDHTRDRGFASADTWGPVPRYVHEGEIKYFRYRVKTNPGVENCDAGLIGMTLETYATMARPWLECSLVHQCIAPAGSNRSNHRQDQAALTLISDIAGYACTGIPNMVMEHMDYKPDDHNWTLPSSCYQDPLRLDTKPP